jgi:hypothetical protein
VIIREAGESDIDSCMELFNIGREDCPKAYEDVSETTVETDVVLGRVLVAEDSHKIVGMISAVPVLKRTLLYMLITDREHRKSTLAPQLIMAAMSRWGNCMAMIVPHAKTSFEKAGMEMGGYIMESRNDS